MLDKKYGYFVTAIEKTSEPIRNTKWLVTFNFNEFDNSSSFPNPELLSFQVKEVDIPKFQNEVDSMYYFGVERKVPTSINNAGSINMTILEGEHLLGYNSLLRWHQQCVNGGEFSEGNNTLITNPFNIRHSMNAPDYSSGSLINRNAVVLSCFSYATGEELFKIKFLNIKPTTIDSVKMAYEGNELYKFGVMFDYDLAILEKKKNHTSTMRNAYGTD
jgi:hypothetical protein